MKIAILSFYSGINKRGVERWVFELASGFSRSYDVDVFQNKPLDVDIKYNINALNIKYEINRKEHLIPLQKRAFLDYKSRLIAKFILKLLPILWRGNYDIIIPTDGGWESAIVRIISWLKRKRMIIVGHAGIGWDDINNLWCFPDRFVALSSYAKSWAKKINPFVKIEYIPDGVSLDKFTPNGQKIKINLQKPVILTVGALTKAKRIDLIIKAVSKFGKGSLLVVGEGEEKKNLETLGKSLLGNQFLIKKFEFDDMPNVYRSCDLFVSASLPYFSFEMVLLEALATNLPVIANNDPIRHEIVNDGGLFVDPTDIDEISKSIEEALSVDWDNKPRTQAEYFSWDKVLTRYKTLFEDISKK